jgi:hypothetical protein
MMISLQRSLEEYPASERLEIAKQKASFYISSGYSSMQQGSATTQWDVRYRRLNQCRKLWDATIDESAYDYLLNKIETKRKNRDNMTVEEVITMELPAKVRHIPIVRPRLASLISKERERPLTPKVYALDTDTVEQRKKRQIDKVLEVEHQKHVERLGAMQMLREAIQLQEQSMQALQQEAQQNPEVAMRLRMQIEELGKTIADLRAQATARAALSEKEIQEINHYFEHSYKDTKELLCEKILQYNISYHRYKEIFNQGFTNKMIHDEEIYFVWWNRGQQDIEVSVVHPENIWYQPSQKARYIGEADWSVELLRYSWQQVVNQYGHALSTQDMDQVRRLFPNAGTMSALTSIPVYTDPDGNPVYSNNNEYAAASVYTTDVFRVFWKEESSVHALLSKGEDGEWNFERWLDPGEEKRLKLKKNERVEKRYRIDLWQADRIGRTNIWCNVGKCEYQPRSNNNLSNVELPYVGRAINYFYQPNSLIWETKELQEVYNILQFQQELLVVLSGVQGVVYDRSQAPSDMEPAEIMHMMKRGLLLIETMKDGRQSNYNQFGKYDQTLSPAIGIIEEMKRSIINTVSMITGVNDQQVGQIASKELVGTSQIALDQSNVVVENYFQQHEDLIERVLSKVAAMIPTVYAEGKQGAYLIGGKQAMLSVPANALDDGEFSVVVHSGGRERKAMDIMERVLQMKMQSGQLQGSAFLEILNMDTMHDMIHALQDAEKKMQDIAQQSEQQKQQAAQATEQMRGEMQLKLKQFEAGIEQQKTQLQMQIEQQKLAIEQQKLAVAQAADQQEAQAKQYAVDVDANVEGAYLSFQYDQLAVNAKHQEIALKLQQQKEALAMLGKSKSTSDGGSKERIKD